VPALPPRVLFGLVWPLASLWAGSALPSESLAIVFSERGPAYEAVGEAMRAQLPPATQVAELMWDDAEAMKRPGLRITVAVGTRACAGAADSPVRTPLLCVFLPRNAFERVTANRAKEKTISALLLDQPLARQLALIRIALREARAVGVLLGPESRLVERPLLAAASAKGLLVASAGIARAEDLYPALQGLLASADVLLAIPDPAVFNSATAQSILRTAFYQRVPILGFSAGYAQAGAALALYTTPEQVGQLAGRWASRFLDGGPLPRPQSPPEFRVAVNERVARALGLELEDEATLERRLRALERAR
jgi:putative tryptophan/tyrosine transport system substrate-binding protein